MSFSLFSVSIDVWIITVNITVLVTLSHSDARTWGYQFLVCFISAYNPPSLPAYKKKIYNKTNQKKEVERIALTGKKNRKKMTSFLGHKHRVMTPHQKKSNKVVIAFCVTIVYETVKEEGYKIRNVNHMRNMLQLYHSLLPSRHGAL